MPSDGLDRDTQHPAPRAPDYPYGGRQAELTHGARELQQYRIARDADHLTETEYQAARERIKNTYGIQPQGRTHAGP